MVLGWLALSNHCALAALAAPPDSAQGCCRNPDAGQLPEMVECCWSTHALKPDAAPASPQPVPEPLLLPEGCGEMVLPWPVRVACALPVNVSDPPEAVRSFAETVLQRTLPALAPPSASGLA